MSENITTANFYFSIAWSMSIINTLQGVLALLWNVHFDFAVFLQLPNFNEVTSVFILQSSQNFLFIFLSIK